MIHFTQEPGKTLTLNQTKFPNRTNNPSSARADPDITSPKMLAVQQLSLHLSSHNSNRPRTATDATTEKWKFRRADDTALQTHVTHDWYVVWIFERSNEFCVKNSADSPVYTNRVRSTARKVVIGDTAYFSSPLSPQPILHLRNVDNFEFRQSSFEPP